MEGTGEVLSSWIEELIIKYNDRSEELCRFIITKRVRRNSDAKEWSRKMHCLGIETKQSVAYQWISNFHFHFDACTHTSDYAAGYLMGVMSHDSSRSDAAESIYRIQSVGRGLRPFKQAKYVTFSNHQAPDMTCD